MDEVENNLQRIRFNPRPYARRLSIYQSGPQFSNSFNHAPTRGRRLSLWHKGRCPVFSIHAPLHGDFIKIQEQK